jgi:hypothetical protein
VVQVVECLPTKALGPEFKPFATKKKLNSLINKSAVISLKLQKQGADF